MKDQSIQVSSITRLWQMTMAVTALTLLPGGSGMGPAPAAAQTVTTAQTTRYWDCCKVSLGWTGKISAVSGKGAVATCAKNGTTVVDPGVQDVCGGGGNPGPAYISNNQQPWAVNATTAYGFAAAGLVGKTEADIGCACYSLQFTSGAISGRTLVVQVVSLGASTGSNHFDLLIPGGGVGVLNGCTNQWSAPADGWGARYGGVSSRSGCDQLPAALRPGCQWRFDWMQNAENPSVSYRRIKCPAEITAKSSCVRADDANQPSQ